MYMFGLGKDTAQKHKNIQLTNRLFYLYINSLYYKIYTIKYTYILIVYTYDKGRQWYNYPIYINNHITSAEFYRYYIVVINHLSVCYFLDWLYWNTYIKKIIYIAYRICKRI